MFTFADVNRQSAKAPNALSGKDDLRIAATRSADSLYGGFAVWRFIKKISPLPCLALALALAGCDQEMRDQPRHEPLEASSFFEDGRASRAQVPGTVPRGHLHADGHLHAGKVAGRPVETLPFAVERSDLERGRERYQIFCAPCHDAVGTGNGMVVQRGFRSPESFHTPRLREQPVGYLFEVITQGMGAMPSYADLIPPQDRWRIVAFLRALQLSRHAPAADLPEEDRRRLEDVE
ncbi:MAG: cytochrome c [Planctomycetes bacterium]|nr:cytochrome c [Planctomycetota bacterium]